MFGLAATEALGFTVQPRHFSGGLGTICFLALERAGYSVVPKGTDRTPALLRSKGEHLVLAGPFGWQVGEAGNSHPMREPPVDGGLDEIGREEGKRDCHIHLADAAPLSLGDAVHGCRFRGDKFIEPTSSASSSAAYSTAFRGLQIVIGHLGEGLPGMFQRLDIMAPAVTKLQRSVTAYLRENIHYTFSGFFFPPTFLALLLELGGVDRMMFSVDHPYQSMAEGRAFLEQLPVSAADKERIAHGNAEKLFKL